jgi:hypothetical protein
VNVLHTNYFHPYSSLSPNHENQLTRAYLALVRLSPLVRSSFLDSVRREQLKLKMSELVPSVSEDPSEPQVRTQVGRQIQSESKFVLSILLTEKSWHSDILVEPSNRGFVYDGLIELTDWVLVIENKPYDNVWEEQLNPNLAADSDLSLIDQPVNLEWRDLIESLNRLLESGSLSPTESSLVEDFQEYVDDRFEFLNPYSSLRRCKESKALLHRRCNQILAEIGRDHGLEVKSRRGSQDPLAIPTGGVREAFLAPTGFDDIALPPGIELRLWPGDTMAQSRAFFKGLSVDEFLALESDGWTLAANPHLAFMSSNLCWWEPPIDLKTYLIFWKEEPSKIRRLQRGSDDFRAEFEALVEDRILPNDALACIDEKFVNTSRQTANLCPGSSLRYVWPLKQAVALDEGGQFHRDVTRRIEQAMRTWGQSLS